MGQYEIVMPKKPHPSYYNTTKLTGEYLKGKENAAQGQARRIIKYFIENPDATFTRDEIIRDLKFTCAPISIGRALTELCKYGCGGHSLEITDIRRAGFVYENSVQHAYRLNTNKK